MILTALKQYYDRLNTDPDKGIPVFGFSREKIDFAIVLNKDGGYVDTADLRDKQDKKPRSREMNVPQSPKRTVGIAPNFMWDNTGYVLGVDGKEKKDALRGRKQFEAFRQFHHELGDGLNDEAMQALLKFLDSWDAARAAALRYWDDMIGKNVVFKFDGAMEYFHDRPAIREAWARHLAQPENEGKGICLVTGEESAIARLHPSIKGVRDAQSSGAAIVSFNLDAFCSYGKEQNFNAPVGVPVTFAYTTALNYLLRYDSKQRVQIGDATTVFWAAQTTPVEDFFGQILDPPGESDAEIGQAVALKDFLDAITKVHMPNDIDGSVPFFILGLAPNASRLSVRFWYASTVADILGKMKKHFAHLRIEKQFDSEFDYPPLWRLLKETAVQGETKNISPLLAGEVMRAILIGGNYPESLLSAVIGRIRAGSEISYLRAYIIKGVLVRNHQREITMTLDKNNTNIGYLLGRLFAVLEKTQREAADVELKATIRDRFFSSASATPRAVFPLLLRLAQHHIQKADAGFRDKQIEEIMQAICEFPAHLSLKDQGMFTIGYYHQRNDFYKKNESPKTQVSKEE
jgi:CRISPR-associated protein Csd1